MPSEARPTVAVDGFGLDQGADALADGVREAARDGIRVRVFGRPDQLRLDSESGVEVIATDEWIDNNADPVPAVRSIDGASIVRTVDDVAAGRSDAGVSHGSTGATMAAATFGLRRMKGIQRPALAAQLPVPGRPALFLDVGANTEVRAQHLVQFAYLGSAFSKAVMGTPDPATALLSVGEESTKGTEEIVEANSRLRAAEGIRFIGNLEGGDLTSGTADVIVSGGFVGNVALKVMEGTAATVASAVRSAARSNPMAMAGGMLMRPALRGVRDQLDPDSTGGAILLGLKGITVVGHGGAGSRGVAAAIRLAASSVETEALAKTTNLLLEGGISRREAAGA